MLLGSFLSQLSRFFGSVYNSDAYCTNNAQKKKTAAFFCQKFAVSKLAVWTNQTTSLDEPFSARHPANVEEAGKKSSRQTGSPPGALT